MGIDIGGTNTDIVLVDENKKICGCLKEPTTFPQDVGVVNAVTKLMQKEEISPSQVASVCIGTTHATNAILEGKDLLAVGLIRIAGHRPVIQPGASWPKILRQKVIKSFETISGGYECHGDPITPFDEKEAKDAIYKLLERGVSALAIVGVFSPMNREQEEIVLKLVQEIAGKDFPVTISADIGGIGFLERENATILNSSLKLVIGAGFSTLQASFQKMGIVAPIQMIHNDGSMMDLKRATDFPIFTISAGQTNSFRGASFLAGEDNAIVVDVGGTSSDIGLVEQGYPKRSCHVASIGGVKLHFALPDVISLAYGGGTIVNGTTVGPESVAKNLFRQAQAFGGDVLTLTDLGLLLGYLQIPNADLTKVKADIAFAEKTLKQVLEEIEHSVRVMRGADKKYPLLLVGGGAPLLSKSKEGKSVEYAAFANAYGAALSEVAATVDLVAKLDEKMGNKILEEIKAEAIQKAISDGAHKESTRVVNVEVIPFAYSKDNLARVIITASGSKA